MHGQLYAGITTSIDELGASATIFVDLSVHPLTAVMKSAYWFTDRYFLYIRKDEGSVNEKILIELRDKDISTNPETLAMACAEFSNTLIDQTVRQYVLTETREVRDALVRKAFSEGKNHLDPNALFTDIRNTPPAEAIG